MARIQGPDVWQAFWPKVGKSGECWVWTGSLDREGYGYMKIARRKHRAHNRAAHSKAPELALAGG